MINADREHTKSPKFDRRRVATCWKAFVEGQPFARNGARDLIIESWERCRLLGVDAQNQRAPHVGLGAPIEKLLRANAELMQAADYTWQVLSESLAASESIFVVTDAQGVLLDVRGNSELVEAAAREHVGPGYDWSEQASGTNAIGTALMLDSPTIVRSVEHFCVAAKIWDCAASPVRDLSDGTLLGLLDVTSIGDMSDSHTLALAVTAAHQIEHTLHSQELARSVQLLNWYRAMDSRWGDHMALLLDRKGGVITATESVPARYGSTPLDFPVTDGRPVMPMESDMAIVECIPYRLPADLRGSGASDKWEGGIVVIDVVHSTHADAALHTASRTFGDDIDPAFRRITTNNPRLIEMMRRAERMARANSPILLSGETGSGKELFARAIHECSNVSSGPFIAVNSGTLTKELAASELLGYEPGAFTGASSKGRRGKFEDADGGTLFLDEIGELPLDVQVHLLRVLQDNAVVRVGGNQERRVQVRIIAATNRNLDQEAEAEHFRSDLYYRLKVLNLALPPLRERPDDIELLVDTFLRRMQGTYGLGGKTVSTAMLKILTDRGCVKRGSSSERSCEIIASLSYWSKWLMKRFIEGENRSQSTLFPESLEDYIAEDNAVRVVDAFVDTLDLKQLGFERAEPSVTGRPGYQPATMLKIDVYGYLNRLQSSRRLERESHRNVELIWLTGRLMPDFKTIADFRKDNRKAIRRVCAEFVGVCRELELFSATLVAIDGSKFKAVNSRDKNFTRKSVERRLKKTQANIDRYLAKLDAVDREEPEIQEVTAAEIKQKIASMEAKMEELKGHEGAVEAHPDNQVSLTDPDARSMMKAGGGSVVGYNVQTAVDSKHHLIAAHEVTNAPTDRSQLSSMAAQATTALDPKALTVIADPGYYKGEEIRACYEAGVMALVPKPRTSGTKAVGLYEKQDFHYESEADQYRCPAGEVLAHRHNGIENGMKMPFYYASVLVCRECTLKSQCTLSKERRIRRWEHESVLDDAEVELKQHPDAMRQRLVEHPYGTIKHWMGSTHFLMKRLPNVQAEMSLHVLAYNLRRAINILGVPKIIEQLQTA